MLAVTNLVSEISFLFRYFEKWNLISYSNLYLFSKNQETNARTIYQFKVAENVRNYRWKYLLLSLSLSTCLCLLNLFQGNKSLIDVGICSYFAVAFTLLLIIAWCHYFCANDFVDYLNKLIVIDYTEIPNNGIKFSHRIKVFCRMLVFGDTLASGISSLASTLFPHAPWNYLQYIHKAYTSKLPSYMQPLLSLALFLFHYIINKNLSNFCNANVIINVTVSNFLMLTRLKILMM